MQALSIPRLARPAALAAAVVLFAACGDGSGPTGPAAAAEAPLLSRIIAEGDSPLVTNQVVDCDGTIVDVTGNGTFTFILREDESGGLHFTGHIEQTLTGVATNLAIYTGSTTGTQTSNVPMPPFELTMVSKGNLKAATGPDFSFRQNFHITMNANGAITATVANASCK
jgi:hypothetical protein